MFSNLFISDIGVKRGQDITFRVDANCEVNGTWKKDGLTLHNGGRINITEPKKYLCFNLTICNATEEDEGEYTLELSNRSGDASGSAKVKVLGKFLNSTLLEFECMCSCKQSLLYSGTSGIMYEQMKHRIKFEIG